MENILKNKKIVCLGGGVGTSNLLRGLKQYNPHLTVISSMADDGGSSGRLRKAYKIMPPGDIINCIAALIENKELAALLTYRFPGNNKANKTIDGQKFGNLLMLAEMQRTGDFYQAIDVTKRMFGVHADILPATDQRVHLSAITHDGRRIHSETTLDLALYSEPHGIKKVYITPSKPKVNPLITQRLMEADLIISGPGDLYTNQLPVLIVPEVKQALIESKAKKIFIVNVANKPFETKGFAVNDFIQAITDHLGTFPFAIVLTNSNQTTPIPKEFPYEYVQYILPHSDKDIRVITEDLISQTFPLYHDSTKLASAIVKIYNK